MHTRWIAVLGCVFSFALGSLGTLPAALGQGASPAAEPAPVDDATRERARAIFGEGVTALDAGDCATAMTKFRQAHEMTGAPSILYNLATAESECHDVVAALGNYEAFLAGVRSGPAARYRPDARRQVAAIRRRLGHVALRIEGLAPGDQVLVDERTIETSEIGDVLVAAGDHVAIVRRDQREWARTPFTIAERQRLRLDVALVEPPAVPTPAEAARASADAGGPTDPMQRTTPERRRRRIIIGSSVAGAVVVAVVIAVVATR